MSEAGADTHRAIMATPPPTLVSAMRVCGDIMWNNMPSGEISFMDFFRAKCENPMDISATTFYFQCADIGMANGMNEMLEKEQDESFDEELGKFPDAFLPAIKAAETESNWVIDNIDMTCGGLQLCSIEKSMPAVTKVTVNINLEGESTVIIPFDPERFGDLYAAVPVGTGTGQLVKSAGKRD